MTDLVNILNCRGVTKVPDHSILIWNITGCANKGRVPMSASVHSAPKLTNIPSSFLNDETSLDQVVAVIDRIERDLEINRDVNNAYDSFKDLVFSEMDRKLPKRSRKFSNGNKTAKSFHKPYWLAELDEKWDAVCACERNWLRSSGSSAEKRRLRSLYVTSKRQFEKLNKKAKRSHQLSEQQRLMSMHADRHSREFWREIGKIGIQNDRKNFIPMKVVDYAGNISTNVDTVISKWSNEYERLFSISNDLNYDENHVRNIKHNSQTRTVPRLHVQPDITLLNAPIDRLEVERSINRAKLRRAAGFDGIPPEVIRNPVCIDLIYIKL